MHDAYREIEVRSLQDNPFTLIADDWMLITAGGLKSFNTMTASWGTLGELWNRKIAVCFVRPTRYTYEFMEREPGFTLSFFDEKYRKALDLCGAVSGRDHDKVRESGLTPFEPANGTVAFAEARLIMICRKLYADDIHPHLFLEPQLERLYPRKDYHRMYIGEISRCLIK